MTQLIGEILGFAGTNIPAGYLLCDGSAVSRTDYAALFAVIGTLFGVGDGSTTFNLPNCKGKVIIGHNSADSDFDTVGKTGGAKSINIAHSHTQTDHTHAISGTTGSSGAIGAYGGADSTASANHTHTFSFTSGGASDLGTNSQLSATQSILNPYITMRFLIRFQAGKQHDAFFFSHFLR